MAAILAGSSFQSVVRRPILMLIGDSIFAGWEPEPNLGDWQIVNSAIGGQTLMQIANALPPELSAVKPDVVVLMGGINDFSHNVWVKTSMQEVKRISIMAYAAQAKLVICTLMLPGNQDVWARQIQNGRVSAFNDWLRRFTLAERIGFADTAFQFEPDSMTVDGLHPNAAGYKFLESVIKRTVRRINHSPSTD